MHWIIFLQPSEAFFYFACCAMGVGMGPFVAEATVSLGLERVSTDRLSFTGRLTLQDTLDLNHYRSLFVVRRTIRWFVGISFALIGIVVIVAGLYSHFTWPAFIVLAVCAYFSVGWLFHERFLVTQRYRRHPEHYVESTVTLTEDSVLVSNINFDMRLNWNQLRSVLCTRRGLLFLLPPYQPLCWLPQRLFEDNDKKGQIIELARTHNVQVKQMA